MERRVALMTVLVGIFGLLSLNHPVKAADTYPVKPIIFIVPNEAGSSADTMDKAGILKEK